MKKKSILLMFALSLLALTSCSGQGIVGTKVTNDEWMQAFDIENFANYTVILPLSAEVIHLLFSGKPKLLMVG